MLDRSKSLPCLLTITILALTAPGLATATVIDFEDLPEGAAGLPFTHMGVTFHDLNDVSGVFPDGETFGPQDGHECLVEDATYFWDDFPEFGSPVNVLTFGISWIPGPNFSIGALSTVAMDFAEPATGISLDIGYYENGPWGGIVYHLDALLGGEVVGSTTLEIAGDEPGRDTPAAATLAIEDVTYDQLHLYATYGDEYSMPRAMIDDITFDAAIATEATAWSRVKALYR